MPYIKQEDRPKIDANIPPLADSIATVGELNYAITRLALSFLIKIGMNYSNISNVIGTLALIPVEINRRLTGNYEDRKIKENGDVQEYERLVTSISR